MPKAKDQTRLTRLNERQQQFVLHYCANGFNAVKAAIAAGYSETYAVSRNTALLKNGCINEAIEKVKTQIAAQNVQERLYTRSEAFTDYDGVHHLALTKAGKKLNLDAANTAIKGKARLFGLDLDHQEIDVYPGRRPDNAQAVQDSRARLEAYHKTRAESIVKMGKATETAAIESKTQEAGTTPTPEGAEGGRVL